MDRIIARDLRKRLEPMLHGFIREEYYDIRTINAVDLLTCNRFDLAAKLLFLEGIKYGGNVFSDLYSDHIRALTLGTFVEPGNEDKNGVGKFVDTFLGLYKNIGSNGLDSDISIVPLARDGSILNGAHRVACAADLGLNVKCVLLDAPPEPYDFNYFWKCAFPESYLDLCARKFVETSENTYVALVWPSARGEQSELLAIFKRLVYHKKILFNSNGFHNLLSLTYQGEPWLGDRRANYPGVSGKLAHCYIPHQPLRMFVFQADSIEEVQTIKQRVRDIFGLGKHSIHINDKKSEAISIAHVLLNENSIHFINNAHPNKYQSTADEVIRFKQWCGANGMSLEDFVVDGGMVLSAYGYRKNVDIDYLSSCVINDYDVEDDINSHDEAVRFHGESTNSLVYDDRFHFRFDGVKFISLKQLLRMKSNRGEVKDKNDILLMRSMLKGLSVKSFFARFRQWVWYKRIKIYVWFIGCLRAVGLYEAVRSIYRKIAR